MPNIGQAHDTCRYWGYEPECADIARSGIDARYGTKRYALLKAAKEKARDELKQIRSNVKTAGYKAQDMGLSKAKAISQAEALESRFPGIKWNVFNHDYL